MADVFDSGKEACQICGKARTDLQESCECGYHFRRMEIQNWTSARRYLVDLKAKDWRKEVQVKKVIWNVQRKKHSRWSQRDYAKHLGQSLSHISVDLKLAEALEKYPQLTNCKNKRHASQTLKSIGIVPINRVAGGDNEAPPFREEKELRDFLARNWDSTPLATSWDLYHSEYRTSVGNIDLLAKHKSEKKWLVIELKVSKTSDDVIGQILRYMGWVKLNLARGENEKVEGLIVAYELDENTFCSLVDLKDLSVKLYRLKEKTIQLEGLDDRSVIVLLSKSLTNSVLDELLEAMKGGQETDPRLGQTIKACS
jgi:hypothetical protein